MDLKNITHLIPWNDNFVFVTKDKDKNIFDAWSDLEYVLELVYIGFDNKLIKKNTIVKKIILEETRNFFGFYPVIEKNILVSSHIKYVGDETIIFVDLFRVDNLDQLTQLTQTQTQTNEPEKSQELQEPDKIFNQIQITKIYSHQIKSNLSCGETIGKICTLDKNSLCVCWGDFTNYSEINCVEFIIDDIVSNKKISKQYKIDLAQVELSISPSHLYPLGSTLIFYSNVLGYEFNKIKIGIFEELKSGCVCYVDIDLPNGLTHNCSKSLTNGSDMYESKIYSFIIIGSKIYCLIRIKLSYKPDPLHIKYYFIDTIIEINGLKSRLIEITQPIYFSNLENHEDYFGLEPYLIQSNCDKLIKIFNQLSL